MSRRTIVAVTLAVLIPTMLGAVAVITGGRQAVPKPERLSMIDRSKDAVSPDAQTEPVVEAQNLSIEAASLSDIPSYVFVNSRELATVPPTTSVAIVKGPLREDPTKTREMTSFLASLVNYEQAAALSDAQAAVADSEGYLARTCSGNLIHPENIPDATLMDLTNPKAVAWRAAMVSEETATVYHQTYLDTLGAFFADTFYTGHPCVDGVPITNTQWRNGSIALVSQVRDLTGKPVIANGRGLGGSGGYFRNQASADELIAAADGVQIEQFARNTGSDRLARDIAYLEVLAAKGKSAYAKCKSTLAACETAFAAGAGPDAYLAGPDQ